MKTTNQLFIAIAALLLLFNTTTIQAQDEEPKGPEYITVTTMHWNMDYENFSMDEWKAVEKEYLDKVTMKNDHVMGSSYYLHQFTADNTELIYVQSYASWDDIDKTAARNAELAKEAWPDEDVRDAFFDKRNAYYAAEHSDEIYATMSGAKPLEAPTADMVTYVRISHFAFPEDGSLKEFKELRAEGTEKIIHSNEYIKAYYPNAHVWGSDRTQFVEAFYVDSLADLDKMFDRNEELAKEAWPDDDVRKEKNKAWGKYFTGVHNDAIYTYVHGLTK